MQQFRIVYNILVETLKGRVLLTGIDGRIILKLKVKLFSTP
jgi:hypothetical protein